MAVGATYKRCGCTDPATGRQLGASCPDLAKRHHGTWTLKTGLDTSAGRRNLTRGGFPLAKDAQKALDDISALVKLAGDDAGLRGRIGDMIRDKSTRGGELPTVDDVRRRLGLRLEAGSASETFGDSWAAYAAGRRGWRDSTRARNEEIAAHWLLPVLEHVAVDRLTGEHCAAVFERVDAFNEELIAARDGNRKPVLPGDVRTRAGLVTTATQHRIYAVLRAYLNHQVRKLHTIPFNPVFAVDLEPVEGAPRLVWTPEQAARFLDVHAGDRLYWLWELALLRGFRRGELCGMPDDAFDADAAAIKVNVALLLVNGRLAWGRPKSKAGERTVGLDAEAVKAGRAHRRQRARERLAAGEGWQDTGLMFTDPGGAALRPDYVSRRFRDLAAAAGLPVIPFHSARHTAATMALTGGVDVRIVAEQLGHSRVQVTQDIYQHVSVALQVGAAETVRALLPPRAGRGSLPARAPRGLMTVSYPAWNDERHLARRAKCLFRAEDRGFEPRKGASPNRISRKVRASRSVPVIPGGSGFRQLSGAGRPGQSR